jgi:hypothetical protein
MEARRSLKIGDKNADIIIKRRVCDVRSSSMEDKNHEI